MTERADAIIEFWIGPAATDASAAKARGKLWYQSTPASDEALREKFGQDLKQAETGALDGWTQTADGTLALVILLDQFSRNLYRGTAGAFANDAKAQKVALRAIDNDQHKSLSYVGRAFLYHPLHHSEDLALHDRNVELFEALLNEVDEPFKDQIDGFLHYAREHRDVIKRFGRFPHRNEVLGRESTPEEVAYLEGGASRYGQ